MVNKIEGGGGGPGLVRKCTWRGYIKQGCSLSNLHAFAAVSTNIQFLQTPVCVCVCACVCVCVCMCVCVCACVHMCICVCTCVCMCVCMFVCMCV